MFPNTGIKVILTFSLCLYLIMNKEKKCGYKKEQDERVPFLQVQLMSRCMFSFLK